MAAPILHLTSAELHAGFKRLTLTSEQSAGSVVVCFPLYDERNMAITLCRRVLHKVRIMETRPFTRLAVDLTTYKKRGQNKYHSWSAFVGDDVPHSVCSGAPEYRILQETVDDWTYYDVFVMKGVRAVYVGTSTSAYVSTKSVQVASSAKSAQVAPITSHTIVGMAIDCANDYAPTVEIVQEIEDTASPEELKELETRALVIEARMTAIEAGLEWLEANDD